MELDYQVPPKWKDKEYYEAALKLNGACIRHVPEHLLTRNLIDIAMKTHPGAIAYVPKEARTLEMIRDVIERSPLEFIMAIGHETKLERLPRDLIRKVVRADGRYLSYAAIRDAIDLELCLDIVKENKNYLRFVPEPFHEAVKEQMKDFDYRPDWLKDETFLDGLKAVFDCQPELDEVRSMSMGM